MSQTREENLAQLRQKLVEIETLTTALTQDGVILVYEVASEHKTVSLKTQSAFSIIVRATVNQEL